MEVPAQPLPHSEASAARAQTERLRETGTTGGSPSTLPSRRVLSMAPFMFLEVETFCTQNPDLWHPLKKRKPWALDAWARPLLTGSRPRLQGRDTANARRVRGARPVSHTQADFCLPTQQAQVWAPQFSQLSLTPAPTHRRPVLLPRPLP